MTLEFTVDHDHTVYGADGEEQLIGTVSFTVQTRSGDFQARLVGGPTPRTIKLPKRTAYLGADGHLHPREGSSEPFRLPANDPAFNLEHITYRADFDLTTLDGERVDVPHTYFSAPETDTVVPLTKVMRDGEQVVMEVRRKGYAQDILDVSASGMVMVTGTAAEQRSALGVNLVDLNEVTWFDTYAAFPPVGVADIVYGDRSNGKLYLWTGSAYVAARATVTADDITNATAVSRGLITAPTKLGARTAIDAAPVLDLYVDDYAATGFTWGVNDTAPWQAAIDAAHAVGAPVKLHARPGRVYKVNPLKVFSSTVIEGHGATLQPITRVGGTNIWDALIYTAGCTPANGCAGDGATYVSDVEIRDFTFDTQSKCYATVLAQNAKAVAVRGCSFPSNGIRQGIRFDRNTEACVAEGNRILSTLDSPFGTIVNAQGISCASAIVDDTAGAYGLYGTATVDVAVFADPTDLSRRHKIINNWIEGGTHGVALRAAEGCLIQGNTIVNTSHRGVICSPVSHRNSIVGNIVRGNFSCAFLVAFGSRFNLIADNIAYCTDSVSEQNAFRASYGASDNLFTGNEAYGVTGAAYRAFTGAINNSFIGNKAESCGIGLEFRSLITDSGYQQSVNTPAMTGNVAHANHFIDCPVGIRLRAGTTVTTGATPATTAGTVIPLRSCSIVGNTVNNAVTNGVQFIEDTAGSITLLVAAANAMIGGTGTDWQTPRNSGHFSSFLANNGSGMPGIRRLPAAGNADEWRDSTDALKAYITSTGGIGTTARWAAGSSVLSTLALAYINSSSAANVGLRIDGPTGQTADLLQIAVGAGPNAAVVPQSRFDGGGRFVTAVHSAPADATLAAGDAAFWFDHTNGAAKIMFKAKQADGTVRTGSLALA